MKSEYSISTPVADLVHACRAGETTAWDELLDRYEPLVYSIAIREGLSAEDAADITQTTFEALLGQLDRLRDTTQIPSWLMSVARRQSWRIRNDRQRHFADESLTVLGTEDGDDPIAERTTSLWVYEGVAQLGNPCRDLIMALYFDPSAPSYADVASRLARPIGSIGPTRARCLERLREILGGGGWRD